MGFVRRGEKAFFCKKKTASQHIRARSVAYLFIIIIAGWPLTF